MGSHIGGVQIDLCLRDHDDLTPTEQLRIAGQPADGIGPGNELVVGGNRVVEEEACSADGQVLLALDRQSQRGGHLCRGELHGLSRLVGVVVAIPRAVATDPRIPPPASSAATAITTHSCQRLDRATPGSDTSVTSVVVAALVGALIPRSSLKCSAFPRLSLNRPLHVVTRVEVPDRVGQLQQTGDGLKPRPRARCRRREADPSKDFRVGDGGLDPPTSTV